MMRATFDRRLIVAIAGVLALALVVGGFLLTRQQTAEPSPAPVSALPSPTASPSAVTSPSALPSPPVSSAPVGSPSPTAPASSAAPATQQAAPAECSPQAAPMSAPNRLAMGRTGVDSPMMSVGTDSSGAAGAPPKNQARTVAWWRNGPKIGSDKGQAVLTIHSYRTGRALGNEMYDSSKKWVVGDIIQISDGKGNVACYRLREINKLWVSDYDPSSTVLYDNGGRARLVIVICWDFQRRNEFWASRILFVADKIN